MKVEIDEYYGKLASTYLEDYASKDKIKFKNFIKVMIETIKKETNDFEIFKEFSADTNPLKTKEMPRISDSNKKVYSLFLYRCAILLLKKLNINIRKEITGTEMKKIFEAIEKVIEK